MAEVRSPTVRRRELGALLRSFRIEQGLTVEQVAGRLLCSSSKVSRMETGRRGVTARDMRDLCDLYGITDQAERDRLMTIAEEGRQQAWWATYDLNYDRYVGLEQAALSIRGYQSSVVPALLQTADYARASLVGFERQPAPDVIEQRVEARLRRQDLLKRKPVPQFWEVLDEAALHRLVGGPQVMRAQLDRLIEACKLSEVTVQVIPFAVGAHPGLETNFKIVKLPPPAPGVVFVEGLNGASYMERPEEIENFERVFTRLRSVALSAADTIELIATVRDSLGLWPTHDLSEISAA
ncbi:MAG TPA: helix-turn-helix transcriptional regulator [Streptosporangiaceae bacterium]|nr:helix-turn-helix transcriptional regulator [Streptosporangiaceae bacterium]